MQLAERSLVAESKPGLVRQVEQADEAEVHRDVRRGARSALSW